jgi:predicted phage terminase large subunit-like protein
VKKREMWLLDVLRRRMEFPELERAIREMAAHHRASVVLIEDRASGIQLMQDLRRENVAGLKGCDPAGDKQMRPWAHTATLEQGLVDLPKQASWLDDYLRELTGFPNSKHDDQVDSTTQALAWMT